MTEQNPSTPPSRETPPAAWPPALAALWWADRGDWATAHALVQADEEGTDAAWVHACLHRQEGDAGNARYWYARAGQPVCRLPVPEERAAIMAVLLGRVGGELR